MPNYLLNLWAVPPEVLQLPKCPAPPPGMDPDPFGVFAPQSVHAAFAWAGYSSLILTVVLVFATYLITSGSLNPRFVRRWWIMLGVTALACFAAAAVALLVYPTHAMAGSCTTNPSAFVEPLPADIVWNRAFAGLAWGALAFTVFSVLLTRTLGRWPWSAGLFHYRGCPIPRYRP